MDFISLKEARLLDSNRTKENGKSSFAKKDVSTPYFDTRFNQGSLNLHSTFNLAKIGIQPKLKVTEPEDIYELQANSVSEQVIDNKSDFANATIISDTAPEIQFLTKPVIRKDSTLPTVPFMVSGPGKPLEAPLMQDMEQRFGYDFSHVRVHLDSIAQEYAQQLKANAYTVGNNIFFGAGQFAPDTHEGRLVIAHELTHVIQQSGLNRIHKIPSAKRSGQLSSSLMITAKSPSQEKILAVKL
jgi:hypothetical protein